MLFLEEGEALQGIARSLEGKLAALVDRVADMPGAVALSPDNLDGQFITPSAFERSLAPSYRAAAAALHAAGKTLVVHVGGPVRRLLPGLAGCGVDCLQGVCGAPQGDASLAEARGLCGPGITLWGGIAQDFLLSTRTQAELERAAAAAFAYASHDPNAVVGVADKVPVDALPDRLESLARLAAVRH
jgi:hypothetical protein